jgi:hypothetical protein
MSFWLGPKGRKGQGKPEASGRFAAHPQQFPEVIQFVDLPTINCQRTGPAFLKT